MYPSDLEELLKLFAAVALICLVEWFRYKVMRTRIDVRNSTAPDSECTEKSLDVIPESTLKLGSNPTKESDEHLGRKDVLQAPLIEGDEERNSTLILSDNDEDSSKVTEGSCQDANKATPFDTEETSEHNSSLPDSPSRATTASQSLDGRRLSEINTASRSSPRRDGGDATSYNTSGGQLRIEHSRNEVEFIENASRSGSNSFQIRGSPPSYEDIATEFYGAGPIFHSWERLGPNGGTISIAGCGILVPTFALTEVQQIDVMCCYPEFPFKNEDWMAITPNVFMGPQNIHFKKQLAFSIPTYFESSDPKNLFCVKIEKRDSGGQWEQLKTAQYSFGNKIVFDVRHSAGFRALVRVGRHLDDRLIKRLHFVGFIKRFTLRKSPDEHSIILRVCNDMAHNVKCIEAEMNDDDYEVVIQPQAIVIRKNQNLDAELTSLSKNVQVNSSSSRFRIDKDELWQADSLHIRTFKIRRDRKEFEGLVNLRCTVTASSEDTERNTLSCVAEAQFHWMQHRTNLTDH